MAPKTPREESQPLLPTHIPSGSGAAAAALSPASRGRLQGRRYISSDSRAEHTPLRRSASNLDTAERGDDAEHPRQADWHARHADGGRSEKARGKQRAVSSESADAHLGAQTDTDGGGGRLADDGMKDGKTADYSGGRNVTVIFANASEVEGGNLELWVEDGESVCHVKEQIKHLRPTLAENTLRLIHAGRLLTDGILLLPWLRSLEERVRRQAAGMGGEVEEVLREVGLTEDIAASPLSARSPRNAAGAASGASNRGGATQAGAGAEPKVFLHCTIGMSKQETENEDEEEAPNAPRRRGFDVLLDAGLSEADVAQMRRQFYESRGEEVPEGLDRGDVDDEHARALEEQWIEGDLTAETATTSTEGMYSSIMHGLLTGFFYPILPVFYFRELPLPNFFDAEAAANGSGDPRDGDRISSESVGSSVFGQRMQMGILLGTAVNFAFGMLRFLN